MADTTRRLVLFPELVSFEASIHDDPEVLGALYQQDSRGHPLICLGTTLLVAVRTLAVFDKSPGTQSARKANSS